MDRSCMKSVALLLASSSSLAIPASVWAQEAAVQGVASVQEEDAIIVTASRRSESLQDVPMSVDVATGATLQKFNLLDVKDVQRLSPGLQLSNSSGRNNTATLRGVTFDPDQGTSPSVDLYINEVPD